jgi:hypothetical protein
VTEEQAKVLSQPADTRGKGAPAAKGKGAQPKGTAPPQTPAGATPVPAKQQTGEGKPKVRTVGPPFIPPN